MWVGEYLDCKCRKKLVDNLVDECTETVEEVKLAKITLAENESENKFSSCTVYIILMTVVSELLLILFIAIGLWSKIMFLALNLVLAKKQRLSKHVNGRNKTN